MKKRNQEVTVSVTHSVIRLMARNNSEASKNFSVLSDWDQT